MRQAWDGGTSPYKVPVFRAIVLELRNAALCSGMIPHSPGQLARSM